MGYDSWSIKGNISKLIDVIDYRDANLLSRTFRVNSQWCWDHLIDHQSLPTNIFHTNHHISSDFSCCKCASNQESILQLLRDCPKASSIWNMVSLDVDIHNFLVMRRINTLNNFV
ncbi:hypothetical protein HKD37_08G023064 [Glycine soja]